VLVLDPRQRHEHLPLGSDADRGLDRHPHHRFALAPGIQLLDLADLHPVLVADGLARQAADIVDRRGHRLSSFASPSGWSYPDLLQPTASTASIGFGSTPSRSASAVPSREISGTSSSSASSQVANAAGPISSSTSFSSRIAIGV